MLTQHGIQLAVHILKSEFGEPLADVCECLLRRGPLTRSGIGKYVELSSEKIKECLRVLIQHNCVQAFALEHASGVGQLTALTTHYMAIFKNVIQRIRFPKFLAIANKELDLDCARLLEGLLQHGRLTLTQIMDKAADDTNRGSDYLSNTVRERFIRLVTSCYIERCPAPEPFIDLLAEEDDNAPKRRASKYSKIFIKEVTLEERVLAASIPMEAERFSVDTLTRAVTEDDENGNGFPSAKSGEKRKLDQLDSDAELNFMADEKEPIWRVNFDEFKWLLTSKVCVENIRARLDDKAGMVLSAMLKAGRSTGKTVSLSVDAVYDELLKSNQDLTLEHVRSYLDQMVCHPVADDLYSIDLGNIIQQAKNEEVETIVLKRYGKEAYKMFRLLITSGSGGLETDKISDKALVDKKDAAKFLFRLWKDNFLLMEKVSGGGSKEILKWTANKQGVLYEVLDELYHAVLNLRIRYYHEMDQQREIAQLEKHKRIGELLKKYNRLSKMVLLLLNSLMMLDDAILLFSDS